MLEGIEGIILKYSLQLFVQ